MRLLKKKNIINTVPTIALVLFYLRLIYRLDTQMQVRVHL